MHKIQSVLEIQINERSYKLECSTESPLGEIYDALTKMKIFIIEKMQQAEAPPTPKSE